MSRRIEGREGLLQSGSGLSNTPEKIEELEERRAEHARKIKGKPEKAFADVLRDKSQDGREQEPEQEEEEGPKDPYLGLSVAQSEKSPELAEGKKGRRAGKVIVKG